MRAHLKIVHGIILPVLAVAVVLVAAASAGAQPCTLDSKWNPMISGTAHNLWGVWGSSGSDVFAVGDGGTILRLQGGGNWGEVPSPTSASLCDVWGMSSSDVFVVGLGGTILHYDGSVWETQTSNTDQDLFALWGRADDDVYAVGAGGTILHFNGDVWSPETSGTTLSLFGLWTRPGAEVRNVGVAGISQELTSEWTSAFVDGAENLSGLWGAASDAMFAAGDGGKLFLYDGVWTGMTSGTSEDLFAVWGSASDNVFAVGAAGTVLQYNGAAWASMQSNTQRALYECWGATGCDVFVVGAAGTILRYGDSPPVPVVITDFAVRGSDAHSVTLAWTIFSDEYIHELQVYRADGDTPLRLLAGGIAATATTFVDRDVAGGRYAYVLAVRSTEGLMRSAQAVVDVPGRATQLFQNQPNPFNPSTTIAFEIDRASHVVVDVFDVRGRKVTRLADGTRAAGYHEIQWNGADATGRFAGSGIYFYRLNDGRGVQTRKMILLK